MNPSSPINCAHDQKIAEATAPICMEIAGHPVEHLAARCGNRAFYTYDVQKVVERVEFLRRHLPQEVALFFSPKVNPFPALLQELARIVDGFDVASGRELNAVLDTSIAPDQCLFTGPGKSDEEIRAAIASGVIVNVESFHQLNQALKHAECFGRSARLAFRINPIGLVQSIGLGRHALSPFGFDPDDLSEALQIAISAKAAVEGFHGFFGSQFQDVAEIACIQEELFIQSRDQAHKAGLKQFFVNLGGGFPAPFYEGDVEFDLPAMGVAMQGWIERQNPNDSGATLVVELGRYLLAEAGSYVARVTDLKTIGDEHFVILNGGLNHNSLAAGVFGRTSAPNARVSLAGPDAAERRLKKVSLVGPLCTSLDRFATGVFLPEPCIGDHIIIGHCGAYGPTFSPSGFLSHDVAHEMLLRPNTRKEIS